MSESSSMPRVRSACCPVQSPVSVLLSSWSPVPIVASWMSQLSWISAAAGSTASSAGTSKPYLLARLGLAPLSLSGCLCSTTSLPLPAALPHCGIRGAASPSPLIISLSLKLSPLALVYRVGEGVPSPPRPCLSSFSTPSTSGVTPEVFSPWGNSSFLGVSTPLGKSTPLPLTGDPPQGFPPLWRPHGPIHCPPLLWNRQLGFLAGGRFLRSGGQ